ncbi:MAG: helix-turn-helix domain-containing protein [Planctomycetota bacterium]
MGTLERRAREREQRRRDILDAARQCFWKHGYARATMPQIARAAELAPGTLYLYFPSKSALYAELLVEGYDEFIPRLRARIAEPAAPGAQAAALIDAFFDFARDCPEYFNIIFFLLQQEGRGPRQESLDGELLERIQAKENACKAIAAEALRGMPRPESGAARGDTNGAAAVDAMWSMLAGVVFFFRGDGPDALAPVAGEAKKILLNAILNGR